MEWWCAATEQAWDWTPRFYLGAWLFSFSVLGAYLWAWRGRPDPGVDAERRRRQRRKLLSFLAGLAVFHASVDWPIGTLGAGYLASVGMFRFVLITLVAAPLMLRGIPVWMARRILPPGRARGVAQVLARGLPALLVFNAILLTTHAPAFTDPLLASPVGAMVMDLAWLAGGFVLWLPVYSPLPEVPRLAPPFAMAYLFAQSVLPTIPASFLTFADFPLYATYELAPRVGTIDPTLDQRNAGLIMKVLAGFLLWGRIAVLWFRWVASEERPDEVTAPDLDFDDVLDAEGMRPAPPGS